MKFFNLHGHTNHSIYDGIGSVEDYVKWCLKNAGEESGGFACTDHGNMSAVGYIDAAQKKYKDALKLVYGTEAYYIPSLKEWEVERQKQKEEKKEQKAKKEKEDDLVIEDERESKSKDYSKWFNPVNRKNHLVLCAYNQKGLENLFRLISRSYREGFYRKPRMDFEMLRQHNEGLIASTACVAGIPAFNALKTLNQPEEETFKLYDKELLPLMELFGKDRFFLELQFNKLEEQTLVNHKLVNYAKKTGYNLIVTADCHYADPKLWRDRELYRMLGYQMKGGDIDMSILEKDMDELEAHLYLKNGDQVFQSYKDSPFGKEFKDEQLIIEAIERTYDIGHNLIENVHPDNSVKLPKTFQVTKDIKTSFQQLKKLCLDELKRRGLTSKEYIDRTAHELKVIKELKVEDYFLAQKEILDVIREDMLTGTARGSGGGSIVNYLLDITFVDPIKNDLLFERFLSLSRKGYPDIDSDIEDKDVAFELLKNRFGEKNVLAVSNYNRLQLKSLVKDISRLYGVEFSEVNTVTKVMESEAKPKIMEEIGHDQKLYDFTFEKAKEHSPTLQKFLQKYPEVGVHIENLYQEIKSIGRHAGGVLVVPDAEGCLPIIRIRGVDQSPITEGITAQHLQNFGLIKFDVLGLATLRIVRRCIEVILQSQDKKPTMINIWDFYNKNLHPDVIDTKDQRVFEKVYHEGKFPSIFQFAEKGVQKFAKEAKPKSVNDISAITALWRPGPLKARANEKYIWALEPDKQIEAKKEHPVLQKVLGKTRNILCYQEQFMQLAHELAGFTLEEADNLRKLLVKPSTSLAEETKKEREDAGKRFVQGCIDNGLTKERAEKLWNDEILGFISYGFNKCLHFSEQVTVYYNKGKKLGDLEWVSEDWPIGKIWHNRKGRQLWVKSRDEKTKEEIFVPLQKVHNHGKVSVYEFTMDDGRKIKCTKDHKFRVEDGRMLPIWQIMEENLEIVSTD